MSDSRNKEIYLSTYILQQDMRIRMPKQILNNLGIVKGKTTFDIFLNNETEEIILRVSDETEEHLSNK